MLEQVQRDLEDAASPEQAVFLTRYFKTGPGEYGAGDIFRGIRVPALRKLCAKWHNLPLDQTELLLQSSYHEDRLLALLILVHKFAKGDEAGKETIYRLYLNSTRFINNWDLVDCSAEYIAGAYLLERDRETLEQLARSASLWERRIAIMATFHFIKRGDFDATLRIAEMLLKDKEDLIHKAVGWMLREVGKRDLVREEAFLLSHHKSMPRTMLRYAIERLPEEKRKMSMKR
jgi:3-methyladenine DNA glycosylase AlkD